MKVDSVAAMGLMGVQKGMQGMRESAAQIASATQSSSSNAADLTKALLSLKQREMQVVASTKVIENANDTIGTLINDLA